MKKILSLALCFAFASVGMQGAANETDVQAANQQAINTADEISKLETQKQAVLQLLNKENPTALKVLKRLGKETIFVAGLLALGIAGGLLHEEIYSYLYLKQKVTLNKNGGVTAYFYRDSGNELTPHTNKRSDLTPVMEYSKPKYGVHFVLTPIIIAIVIRAAYSYFYAGSDSASATKQALEEEIESINAKIAELKEAPQICSGLPFLPADHQTEVAHS